MTDTVRGRPLAKDAPIDTSHRQAAESVAMLPPAPDAGQEWERKGSPGTRTRIGRRVPGRVGTVFAELPFIREASVEQRRQWHRVVTQARQTADNRRARVLAYPDLADRLARSLRYSTAANWSGFIPPAQVPGRFGWVANTSGIRRELIEILKAVLEREREAA